MTVGAAPPAITAPRFPLATMPTPLEPATRLSAALGIELWIKRDDLLGLALGGSKARKLKYLVADALDQGATMLLATAAAQSNYCRMTAAAGRRAGLRVGLLLRGTPDTPVQGNLLLDHLLGAEIQFIDELNPYAPVHQERLSAWADQARAHGERPYVIDLHNGSRMGALATLGYLAAVPELVAQCRDLDIQPDHLYVAVGSGSTLAGLHLGWSRLDHTWSGTRLVGVMVGAPAATISPKVREFVASAAALTRGEIEGRRQVQELLAFFRKWLPGFEHCRLLDTASTIGVRETRRIAGEYTLTLDDLATGRDFDDVIAFAGYPVDIHSPTGDGGGASGELETANVYQIPFRSLVPADIDQLLVAGRSISATHEAMAATRVMPPAFAMGEAAGTAAAIAAEHRVSPRQVDVGRVQRALIRQGAYLGERVPAGVGMGG